MTKQIELELGTTDGRESDLIKNLMDSADRVLIKKLSRNDRDWARFENKHQAGVYIPAEQRDGGFFPPLIAKERQKPDLPEIREAFLQTHWPQVVGKGAERVSRIVHYTSKGPETHLTRVPKEPFAWLSPASFLVMGRAERAGAKVYECLTIDSVDEEAGLLGELFDLPANFLIGEFVPSELRAMKQDLVLDFVEQIVSAWSAGEIDRFASEHAVMPSTNQLAAMARQDFLERNGLEMLNPFELWSPGDALREISRNIEWDLFRTIQRRVRAVELVRIVLGDATSTILPSEVIRRLVDRLPDIDALMLSASQQRKSRAGYSYEHHIEAMLTGGGIPFEKQVVIEARKRPDFTLPSLKFIDSGTPEASNGLILSAKTTLRERWKQVEREKGNRNLYLTTVDENIAANAIEEMASIGVILVIPESLMGAKETEYSGHYNVLTFWEFCTQVIHPRLHGWASWASGNGWSP